MPAHLFPHPCSKYNTFFYHRLSFKLKEWKGVSQQLSHTLLPDWHQVQTDKPYSLYHLFFILQIPRCAPCPAGYSCANVTQPPVPCLAGYYSLQGDASCTECEAGQACTDPAQAPKHCSIGTYSQKVCMLHAIYGGIL